MNSLRPALAIALVVGLGLAAGFLSYRLQSERRSSHSRLDGLAHAPSAPSPASAEGVAVADSDRTLTEATTAAAARPPRPVPSTLPDLALPDLSGATRNLRSFGARPLIVNFWATWCAPCRREIPLLRELRARYGADRLEIIGIAVDSSSAVQQYLRHTPIDYPLLIGEQQGLAAAEQFGVDTVLPFSVFADATGGIVAVKVGELHREEADFILSQIRALAAGQASMAEVRSRISKGLQELALKRARAQQNSG